MDQASSPTISTISPKSVSKFTINDILERDTKQLNNIKNTQIKEAEINTQVRD